MSDRDETTVRRESGAPGRRAWTGIAVALAVGAAAIIGARLLRPAPQLRGTSVEFELQDTRGRVVSDRTLRGRPYAILFGFTRCPDVCPTTLSDLAQVKRRLGKDGERLQVIFITVDPERDSQAVLERYVPAFDPSFVALYGSAEQTAATAKEFKVFYQKVAGKTATSYSIDHTAGTYVIDREGRVRLFVKHGEGVEPLVADLKRLLS